MAKTWTMTAARKAYYASKKKGGSAIVKASNKVRNRINLMKGVAIKPVGKKEFWVTDGGVNAKGYHNSYGKGNDHKPYRTYKSALRKANRFTSQSKRKGRSETYFVATFRGGKLVKE